MSDEDLDMLSAIWVISSNDDNPIISYRGLCVRLAFSDEKRLRQLVYGRRDLFRLRVLNSRMDNWKNEMRNGKKLPVWISEIESKNQRRIEIDALKPDDVFRNQFRIEDGAPKCDLKTIDWGVQYIERLRKAASDRRQERRVFLSSIFSAVSVAVAIGTLIGTVWFQARSVDLQVQSINAQTELKKYEVTFKPKQESYFGFMSAVEEAYVGAELRNVQRTGDGITRMETMQYAMEPFLNDDQRVQLSDVFTKYIALCNAEMRLPPVAETNPSDHRRALEEFAAHKTFFRTRLYSALFGK
jgi:hypothetical protein